MEDTAYRAVAIVGVGAILPDAPNASAFWQNVKNGRYSISEVTPDRWDPALYYDPDPKVPDKTYSKIGGWVRQRPWDPIGWHLPIPPRVSQAMDETQKWAVACTYEALADYKYPQRPLNTERTAVILGNAMAGEKHYLTGNRIAFPEYARELAKAPGFAALPQQTRESILRQLHANIVEIYPEITEDTMPGELSNCIAGRIANLFNFRGPNYVCDAACASAMAAISAAVEGLIERDFDTAITGGIDRNMGASTFVKFCKIGALSATGTRPYADGADGFVMGEGAVVFILKRLADAVSDGDKIYAVLRGIGGASDGKGKGITAPNPIGQRLAIERAWKNAGLSPATATLIEGHGTSTRVGDVVEVESLIEAFAGSNLERSSVALGSVKSNIGHLKAAAGAAGLLKATMALYEKVLPPSLNFDHPNPNIDFANSPLYVNTELRQWTTPSSGIRRAGVSAFGFGGTNFHIVLEEYVSGRLSLETEPKAERIKEDGREEGKSISISPSRTAKPPLRGALLLGASSQKALAERLQQVRADALAGKIPAPAAPLETDLRAPERIAIDYENASDLADKTAKALKAIDVQNSGMWKALRAQGIFRGSGPAPKVAFLYTGQGSQYVNMLKQLCETEPVVAEVFAEADRVMAPLLGKPLTDYIFVNQSDPESVAKAEQDLRQTAITQPAVLAVDIGLTKLLASYGIKPDMVMGHSLGEYGALVAAEALQFSDALEAVSARGREMTKVSVNDNGKMAAVFAPLDEIELVLRTIDGYVVIANINSRSQAVIGGASQAVERASEALQKKGYNVVQLPVSHAFHTSIVAPASEPLRRVLQRLRLQPPKLPTIANVSGEFYPASERATEEMLDILARQVASPVQFVKGLQTLYDAGARVFVEVGPKKALQGFVDDLFGDRDDVISLSTNHPKIGDLAAFNQALCGLYAAGLGVNGTQREERREEKREEMGNAGGGIKMEKKPERIETDTYNQLGRLFVEFLERGMQIYRGEQPAYGSPVVIMGAALGLPGTEQIFDDSNVGRILRGEQFIDVIPTRFRRSMVNKKITRLVKSEAGGPTFESIDDLSGVIKLAARGGKLHLEHEFGVSAERVAALDRFTQLAIGAGLEAMRDAGIPLVLQYKTTTKGTQLPDRWRLPDFMQDETGVIFASAFPGLDSFAENLSAYYADRARHEQLERLEQLRSRMDGNGSDLLVRDLDQQISELRAAIEKNPYNFDRRFLFRVLSMGHSQFAELIGARGPNTQINSACASTTQAISLAEDWIRAGRCRCVIIVAADDITNDNLLEWFGAGFLASGAAATDELVEEAALPFDRRRHGMILGMGACAIVVESTESARERGLQPICEVLSAVTANSAYHGTRLDVNHICDVMERLIAQAENRWGIERSQIAQQMVFVSHETYTPARGGSASAEVHALRHVFGNAADQIVVANTKGFTGHPMGVGIEDVVGIKTLETGLVPPVANFKEVDPELGRLNLSRGGAYPISYALRLGAGFGSQISMSLMRWVPTADGKRRSPEALGFSYRVTDVRLWNSWLNRISGNSNPELEVVHRTLRVKDHGAPKQVPIPATRATVETATEITAPTSNFHPSPQVAAPAVASAQSPAEQPEAQPAQAVDQTVNMPAASADLIKPAGEVDSVKEKVLSIVSEKTGYPIDMLDVELDMEADLGVDTVKQAEVFAAIRGDYNIPRDENLKLRDFPTLARVIQFVYDRRPDLAGSAQTISIAASNPQQVEKKETSTVAVKEEQPRDGDPVKNRLLALVSEKTGYPIDMLDLELDLEADLGVDTVKQAEIFAAIRGDYNIPRDENLKLRDFPTLAHVIQFVYDRRPDLSLGAQHAIEKSQEGPVEKVESSTVVEKKPLLYNLDAANAIPRRVPAPLMRPPLKLCKSTGVKLSGGSRVVIMPDRGGVADILIDRLKERGVETLILRDAPDTKELINQIKEWLTGGPIEGVYWLPALDREADLVAMTLDDWHDALRPRIKHLYGVMRALYNQIVQSETFLLAAVRLGGQHGYDEAGAYAPMGGAVVGFTKSYKRERIDALVKAVDFESDSDREMIAAALLDETESDPGVVEVGYKNGMRWAVGLQEVPAGDGKPGMALNKDTVFIVTGAAGSIVSAITSDLAAASGGIFYLLDLIPEPDPNNADIARFITDKENLKRDLFERLKARGEKATPAMVEKELAALERLSAGLSAIRAVEAAGGKVHYHSVNLKDAESVARVIEDARKRYGRVDLLIHAAGLEISRFLSDKEPSEFDLVFDVKSDGWFNLIHSIGDMPLGAAVAFSSIAGRFGNGGQTDYSSANDLLCKYASSFRNSRPDTRAIAIDWTAWGGIGMATRGSIPKMMEIAGIDMLSPEAGIPTIRRELTAGATRGEVVIAERLGILMNEWDETGGLDLNAAACSEQGPMVGKIKGMGLYTGLTADLLLDPSVQPFLYDHQIEGTPVLPGVMGIEGFAEIASLILDGWHIAAIEDVNFLAPFKFYRNEPRVIGLQAKYRAEGDTLVADCRLIGTRKLPNQQDPLVIIHFTGRVKLARRAPAAQTAHVPDPANRIAVAADDIYSVYFHGPAYKVLERAWKNGAIAGLMAQNLPANHHPADLPTAVAPRLIELCFQTAGIWEMGTTGLMGLPSHIDRIIPLRPTEEIKEGRLYAVVNPNIEQCCLDAQVVDTKGTVYMILEGYRTAPLPNSVDSEQQKLLRSVV